MARQHIVDKKTIEIMLKPYKDMIVEYKEFMSVNILDEKGNYDKLVSIAKSLILIKDYVLSEDINDGYFSQLLISDINSSLYCIRNNLPKRYFYFSLRGCIESFARLNIEEKDLKIVDSVFESFKNENAALLENNILYEDFYSVIKDKYSLSSGYVHGSQAVTFSLKEAIDDFENHNIQKDLAGMINDLEIITSLIKKFYLNKDSGLTEIKHIYNRKLIVLKYLLSKAEVTNLLS